MTTTNVAAALSRLGFSEIEAAIYVFLLTNEPCTGYRVSHAIGKPTANTYQAIAALERKGALFIDEGENRVCRAVPPQELLARIEREFRESKASAEDELLALEQTPSDERVYQLKSVEQVLERTRGMLAAASEIVLLDIFPEPLEALAPELTGAAARGVRVVAKTYGGALVEGVQRIETVDAEHALTIWPGQQISCVTDAREHLLALLSPSMTTVRQAVWSNSVFLSCMQHNHLAMEILVGHYRTLDGVPRRVRDRMEELDDISLLCAQPPGLAQLQGPRILEGQS